MDNGTHKLLIDIPSKAPTLGYEAYASSFADIIHRSSPQFAIGIFGGWGSGKTTLMQSIQNKLDGRIVIPVEFSAWRYEKEEHLIVPLLETVKESLIEWTGTQANPDVLRKADKTGRTIGKVITSLLAGLSIKFGVPKAFDITYNVGDALDKARDEGEVNKPAEDEKILTSLYHSCFTALKKTFNEFFGQHDNLRFVVFIDDLDRCLPHGVMQVLESMKLFFDLHGFIFVVGLDQDVVEWCIDRTYGENQNLEGEEAAGFQLRGADYIKKIIQVPFTLFPVSVSQLDDFLESLITENALSDSQSREIREIIKPHLGYIVDESGVNPREIKRFINAYTLNMKIKPELNSNAVLALKTISFRRDWETVQQALYSSGEVFQDSLMKHLKGQDDILGGLNPIFGLIPQSFLTYVSPGAPGHDLISAQPLDDYIRAGAATSASSDTKLLDTIQSLGKLRATVMDAPNQASLNEMINRLDKKLIDFKNRTEPRATGAEPFYQAAIRAIEGFTGTLGKTKNIFDDPNQWTEWKKGFDKEISSVISALVSLYQSSGSA